MGGSVSDPVANLMLPMVQNMKYRAMYFARMWPRGTNVMSTPHRLDFKASHKNFLNWHLKGETTQFGVPGTLVKRRALLSSFT